MAAIKSSQYQSFTTANGACSAGTVTIPLNVPSGRAVDSINIHAVDHAKAVKMTVKAYVDPGQTATTASFMRMAEFDDATLVTSITLAATATGTNGSLAVVSANVAAIGVPSSFSPHYGLAVTIATTKAAGTGNWYVSVVSREV